VNESVPRFVVQGKPESTLTMKEAQLMKSPLLLLLTGTALAAVVLTGCAATASPSSGSSGSSQSSTPASVAPAASGDDAATAKTSLGTVVVDGKGLTAYYFDKDVAGSGKSSCAGQCAALWPAITASGTAPTVAGITGKVGTIPAAGGGKQVTIDGRPIYTFAKDTKAGDTNGQGVGKAWFAVSPTGKELKSAGRAY
jgi:predicted lipoprotein with Yx(FWY)xxD motif